MDGPRGIFGRELLEQAVRNTGPREGLGFFDRRYTPRTSLIHVENTANGGGGSCWPLETLAEVRALASEHDIPVRMRCCV